MKKTILSSLIVFVMFANTVAMAANPGEGSQPVVSSVTVDGTTVNPSSPYSYDPKTVSYSQLAKLLGRSADVSSATAAGYSVTLKSGDTKSELTRRLGQNYSNSFDNYYDHSKTTITIVDSKSDIGYEYKMDIAASTLSHSPQAILKQIKQDKEINDFLNAINESQSNIRKNKITIWDAINVLQSTGASIEQFPAEALTFYMGVGANHILSLMLNYQKNPMALELFLEELKSPIGQLGFLAFMIGNRHAMNLFTLMFDDMSNPFHATTRMFFAPYLSMAVGSFFSNVSHDLIALTQPCFEAYTKRDENHNLIYAGEAIGKKCQEGWDAVFTSDKASQYVTSTLSLIMGGVTSALITAGLTKATAKPLALAKSGLKKVRPLIYPIRYFVFAVKNTARKSGVTSLIRKTIPKQFRYGVANALTNIPKLGMRIGGIVIFLKSDEFWHNNIHHLVESTLFSGPELRENKLLQDIYMRSLKTGKIQDDDCNKMRNLKFENLIFSPVFSRAECDINVVINALALSNEKHQAWRKNLMYPFDAGYNIWLRYLNEYETMRSSSEIFIYNFFRNLSRIEVDTKNPYSEFNSFVHDNPLNGVSLSATLDPNIFKKIEKNNTKFDAENLFKAHRVIESLPIINKAISKLESTAPNSGQLKDIRNHILSNLKSTAQKIENFRNVYILKEQKATTVSKSTKNTQSKSILSNMQGMWGSIKDYTLNLKERVTGIDLANLNFPSEATPEQRTGRYNELAEALKIINDLFTNYYKLEIATASTSYSPFTKVQRDDAATVSLIRNSVREIRTFLGKPYPVRKKDAFIAELNDYLLNEEQYEIIKTLWENENSPSHSLIKELVCSVPYNSKNYSGYEIRDGFLDYMDYSVQGISKELNKLTAGRLSTYDDKLITENARKLWTGGNDMSRSGTGLSFLTASVVSPSVSQEDIKRICSNPLIPVISQFSTFTLDKEHANFSNGIKERSQNYWDPRASMKMAGYSDKEIEKRMAKMAKDNDRTQVAKPSFSQEEQFKVSGKSYASLFDFLIDNFDRRIFDKKISNSSSEDGNSVEEYTDEQFNAWYEENIRPAVKKVQSKMASGYDLLLKNELGDALKGTSFNWNRWVHREFTEMFTLKFQNKGSLEKVLAKSGLSLSNANSVLLDYVHEMDRYTSALEAIYSKMLSGQDQIRLNTVKELKSLGQSTGELTLFGSPSAPGSDTYTHDLKIRSDFSKEKNLQYFRRQLNALKVNIYGLLTMLKDNNLDAKDIISTGEVPELLGKTRTFNDLFSETLVNFGMLLQILGIGGESPVLLKYIKTDKDFKELGLGDKSIGIAYERLENRVGNDNNIKPFFYAIARDKTIMNHELGIRLMPPKEQQEFMESRPLFKDRMQTICNAHPDCIVKAEKEQVNPIYPYSAIAKDTDALLDMYRLAQPITWGAILKTQFNVSKTECFKQFPERTDQDAEEIFNIIYADKMDLLQQHNITKEEALAEIKETPLRNRMWCQTEATAHKIEAKQELMASLIVTNELYSLLEDIYMNTMILSAARPSSEYKENIENYKPAKNKGGQGSRIGF